MLSSGQPETLDREFRSKYLMSLTIMNIIYYLNITTMLASVDHD